MKMKRRIMVEVRLINFRFKVKNYDFFIFN